MTHLAPGARTAAWKDILERSAWTALESGIGVLGVDGFIVDLPDQATLAVIGISTLVAFVKNVGRQRLAVLGKG